VWMVLTHLPTFLPPYTNQPFGFVAGSPGGIASAILRYEVRREKHRPGKIKPTLAEQTSAPVIAYLSTPNGVPLLYG
jgi:hypothetical protein